MSESGKPASDAYNELGLQTVLPEGLPVRVPKDLRAIYADGAGLFATDDRARVCQFLLTAIEVGHDDAHQPFAERVAVARLILPMSALEEIVNFIKEHLEERKREYGSNA